MKFAAPLLLLFAVLLANVEEIFRYLNRPYASWEMAEINRNVAILGSDDRDTTENFAEELNQHPAPWKLAVNIQRVFLIGGENRLSTDEFAEEQGTTASKMQEAFGATGTLRCGNEIVTSQVTGARNVITSVAHAFFNEDCTKRDLKSCSFKPLESNSPAYNLDAESLKLGGCQPNDSIDMSMDWATVKLLET